MLFLIKPSTSHETFECYRSIINMLNIPTVSECSLPLSQPVISASIGRCLHVLLNYRAKPRDRLSQNRVDWFKIWSYQQTRDYSKPNWSSSDSEHQCLWCCHCGTANARVHPVHFMNVSQVRRLSYRST